jgi:uncharacterized protein (DUF4415 family)
MAKDQRGRRTTTGTTQKQPARGAEVALASDGKSGNGARGGHPKVSEAWLGSVVFGTQETKMPVNIRLDAEIVRYFRAGGAGYQTRINEVLKAFVHARIRAGDLPGAPPKPRGNGRKRVN